MDRHGKGEINITFQTNSPPGKTAARRTFIADIVKAILALAAGLYCLLLLAESNSRWLKIRWLHVSSMHSQFAWLVMGAALIAYGLAAAPLFPVPKTGITSKRLTRRFTFHVLLLTTILLLAFMVRAVNLEQAVFMYVDEIGSAEAVVELQKYDRERLLLPHTEVAGWSRFFAYTQLWGVNLFGGNLTGLRAMSVVVGTLSVAAMYGFARQFFDRHLALLATLWLATFPPHIHFSRLGIPNIADPLFGMLALTFLMQGYRSGQRRYFALAGVMLGLTQYFYEAGRLLYPLVIIGFAGAMILGNGAKIDATEIKPMSSRHLIKGLVMMIVAAVLLAFPVYLTLAINNRSLATRFNQMNTAGAYFSALSNDPAAWLRDTFAPPFLHLVALPDRSGLYYGGNFGLILPWIVPFFLVGVVYAVRRWRQPALFMLLLWVVGTAVGNGFIEQNVYSSRYVVVLPALVLFIILGIKVVITRWQTQQHIIIAAAIVLALTQVPYYFGSHLTLYNQQIRVYRDFADIMPRSRSFPVGTQLHLITDDGTSLYQLEVLAAYFQVELPVDQIAPEDFNDDYLNSLPITVDHAFYVMPEDNGSIERIQQRFNTGQPQPSPNNIPPDRQYWLLYAPAPRGK